MLLMDFGHYVFCLYRVMVGDNFLWRDFGPYVIASIYDYVCYYFIFPHHS
jgi:hypothetical protein